MAKVKKDHVRITDKNTGKSTEKPKRAPLGSGAAAGAARALKNRVKVVDKATGRTADVHKPVR